MADAREKQALAGFGFASNGGGGSDLFDGLALDYAFLDTPRTFVQANASSKENDQRTSNSATLPPPLPLEPAPISSSSNDAFGLTPRVSAHLLSTLDSGGDELMSDHMLFDHDVSSTAMLSTPQHQTAPLQPLEDGSDDLLTPLSFAFSPSPVRYRTAPQHKHKRVRSNPDVLFRFQQQPSPSSSSLDPVTELEPAPPASTSPARPSIHAAVVPARGRTVSNELANAVFSSILNDFQDPPATPPMPPIGPVDVMTPLGLRDPSSASFSTGPAKAPAFSSASHSDEPSFKDMDEFLQDLSWAEIPIDPTAPPPAALGDSSATSSNSAVRRDDLPERQIEASPVAFRSQRIHEGVQELKMKRKRPQQHARHHSNPVDLLHNLDQFRILAQQTKQQQQLQQLQQSDPSSVLNPFSVPSSLGVVSSDAFQTPTSAPQNAATFSQFQVPAAIASGAARSLHDRRASLPNTAAVLGGASVPPRAAARRAQRSTGLSMDLSQMNLGFLSVPEEDFQQLQAFQSPGPMAAMMLAPQPPTLAPVKPGSGSKKAMAAAAAAAAAADEANRKLYKCGRCGQPKVGHVCTMPDQRNNWTQVDLDVTKGVKVMRINCHILPVKTRWVAQHEENVRDEQQQQPHVTMLSA